MSVSNASRRSCRTDEVKQKHAAKTEKRQSVVEELSIDNDVKVSLMKARMLTAGG